MNGCGDSRTVEADRLVKWPTLTVSMSLPFNQQRVQVAYLLSGPLPVFRGRDCYFRIISSQVVRHRRRRVGGAATDCEASRSIVAQVIWLLKAYVNELPFRRSNSHSSTVESGHLRRE